MQAVCNEITVAEIKNGIHVIIKRQPCRVLNIIKQNTGKHGFAKANIIGIGVLDAKIYKTALANHMYLPTFDLIQTDYQVIKIDGHKIEFTNNITSGEMIIPNPTIDIIKDMATAFNEGKSIIITVIKAPVERTPNNYIYREAIISFRCDDKKIIP